jgi:hypothetical protein
MAEVNSMADSSQSKSSQLSIDAWSVLLALALVALVRFGILRIVPW